MVKWHHFIKDILVASLFDVRCCAENQPQGIVVETTANVMVALLGQRLILVVSSAVFKLRRRQIENALPGLLWGQMNKSEDVLVGVAKPDTPSDTGLEVRCAA